MSTAKRVLKNMIGLPIDDLPEDVQEFIKAWAHVIEHERGCVDPEIVV